MINDAELLMLLMGMVIVSITLFLHLHDMRIHNDTYSTLDNHSMIVMGIGIVIGAIGICFIAYEKFMG